MVLSGTLREFILADVFQLLTQQKITGKLILTTTAEEGVVVFKSGVIVGSYKDTENFETKLQNFLIDARGINVTRANAMVSAFKDDIHGLTSEIVSQSIMTQEEISSLSQSTVEDITCSMFLWTSGSYKFNSMRNVDRYIPGNCMIPIENIVMEAMRRFDEWKRMQELMTEETIFVLTTGQDSSSSTIPNPIYDPATYLCRKINGTAPVKTLIDTTPLTQYKIYETLYGLLQSNQITPLSDKITQSVHAALERKVGNHDINTIATFFSSVIVAACILVVILLSNLVFKGLILSKVTVNSYVTRSELPRSIAEEHKQIAQIFFLSHRNQTAAEQPDSLVHFNLITKKDLKYFKMDNEKVEQNSK